jgi:AsmA protein
MKAVKVAAVVIGAAILAVGAVLVLGIPSEFLNSTISSRVENATGYRVTIEGSTRLSLWPSLRVTLNKVALEDPRDRTGISRLAMESLEATATLSSLWSGHPEIRELVITHPVLYQPLLRQRLPDAAAPTTTISPGANEADVRHISIRDGEVAFSTSRERVESRISRIDVDAAISMDRKVVIRGNASGGEHPIRFEIKAAMPAPPLMRATVPFDFAIELPGMPQSRVAGHADGRLNGSLLLINSINGALDDAAFTGWASVDIASKPLLKVDLDLQKIEIPVAQSSGRTAAQPWSDAPIDISGLNYIDAQIRLSVSEADIGGARVAPLAVDAKLAGGVLKAAAANLGAYGGQVSGEVILDASSGSPGFAMHSDLVGVRALPLLNGLADFDRLDGRVQAKMALRSTGTSQRALMANMAGTVFVNLQDGAIRGINVAQMIRSLTTSPLSGWQDSQELSTDLSQLSASFTVDRGQAVTTDLNLIGPLVRVTGAGTIALDTKMMGFRVEPKLVMTTEGQGRTSDPVAFGIPVMIEGPWSEPKIYPDLTGMLDNPTAGYAKLREMGKGLFGPDGAGNILSNLGLAGTGVGGSASSNANPQAQSAQTNPLGGALGEAIGNLIQQGLSGGTGANTGHSRSLPSSPTAPQVAPVKPSEEDAATAQPDSQPMNDVLRQLFNR